MRIRQVHLDFHTSEKIPGIGTKFSKKQFQDMLKLGHVDSITVFAKCHHGWSYHPTQAGNIHPHLKFDLLKEMIDAAHEIGVKTPVYISAGLDEQLAVRKPQWLIRNKDESTRWVKDFFSPGYHEFCMNTKYLDYLIEQVREVTANYDADGIFLDIVGVRRCYCRKCINELIALGKDINDGEVIEEKGEETFKRYALSINKAIWDIKPHMKIFHNSGHIRRGRRDLAHFNTHLELESLPTGGWGYDHFPLSARYAQTLDMEYLGMTGKFHTTWGEFGGYKHPNALRYETALSLANSAACSIGDQLHPEGMMDEATYSLIGKAYGEVKEKEKWCINTTNVADVGLLSVEAAGAADPMTKTSTSDGGAVRILLEGKILFDVIDLEADFSKYKVIILPDRIRIDAPLKEMLDKYISAGGKILATGESGLLAKMDTGFALDFGVEDLGENHYKPDYLRPLFDLKSLDRAAFVCYSKGRRIANIDGEELAIREDPYFNREASNFCSHQHTPGSFKYGGPGIVRKNNLIYIAWNVFEDYAVKGSLFLKEVVLYALSELLKDDRVFSTDLPAQGIATLMELKDTGDLVNHLLYASPVKRGERTEIIEDIIPLYNVNVEVISGFKPRRVYLAPSMEEIKFSFDGKKVSYTVPRIKCHQMVVLEREE